mmetsp:Transcript_26036/g.23054  ORF Transcript_26036/g.23054 Transcript_26036/m.23054 type:complete len:301 (+) Transcript_26036:263-1165(+)
MMYSLTFVSIQYIKSKYKGATFWSWEKSNFRNPHTNGVYWPNVIGIIWYLIIVFIGGTCVVYTFQFCIYGNINQGIITSLFGLSSIFSAIMAYFLFGDKLKIYHVAGMILMLLCVVGLGLGSTKNVSEHPQIMEESDNPLMYGLLAIILGIACPFFFALGGITVRYFGKHHKFNPVDMTIMYYLIGSFMLVVGTILTYKFGSHEFILKEFLEMLIAGLIGAVGGIFLNLAVSCGLAGPVFALANIQVIIQTLLDALIIGEIPTLIETVSALFGVLGCCTIALGPEIYKLYKSCFIKESVE